MDAPSKSRHLTVDVHWSLHPEAVDQRLKHSLQQAFIPTRMLYETPRQVRFWRELASTYSPSVRDRDGIPAYEEIHRRAVEAAGGAKVQLVGIACGDGRKEESLGVLLSDRDAGNLTFIGIEGSLPLIQLAASRLGARIPDCIQQTILADLEAIETDPDSLGLARRPDGSIRVVTLYGVLPGMEPHKALASAKGLLEPGDLLLVSANSIPESSNGMKGLIDQYDNDLTRRWIGLMLDDLGMEDRQRDIEFSLQEDPELDGMKTITATVEGPEGMELTVFRSARQSPEALRTLLEIHGLEIIEIVVSPSGEETVALARARA